MDMSGRITARRTVRGGLISLLFSSSVGALSPGQNRNYALPVCQVHKRTHIYTDIYSAKNRENESEALARDKPL